MDKPGSIFLNSTRLLCELQSINVLSQSLCGCLEPEAIARRITDGLIDKFDCAFARIWLVESDRTALRLVASSGMYTRLDGDFARVPMGAYKVGKIAQHGIPFLSNQLAKEPWVKDRQWAIANGICGFAGLPLAVSDNIAAGETIGTTIGVLAVFSHRPMEAEFLEALRLLCSSVAVALYNAQLHRGESKLSLHNNKLESLLDIPLSEQISKILNEVRLILVGTERPLATSINYVLLKTTETLKEHNCNYCRLTYESGRLCLEGMLLMNSSSTLEGEIAFSSIASMVNNLGGKLQTAIADDSIIQVRLFIPYGDRAKNNTLLSHREREIIQLLAEGWRDREIAQKLFISDRTVKFHVNNAMTKLKARTRTQAIYQASLKSFLAR